MTGLASATAIRKKQVRPGEQIVLILDTDNMHNQLPPQKRGRHLTKHGTEPTGHSGKNGESTLAQSRYGGPQRKVPSSSTR